MEGEVLSLGFGGYGVIKKKENIFFISGALPGEVVEFSVDFKRKGVNFGRILKVVKESDLRVEPFCKYFLNCGGCHFQNLKYENQIIEKEKILKEILKKIGKIEAIFEKPIFTKEYGYRTKVQFEIDQEGNICFHKRNSNKLLKIKSCPVLCKPLELFLKRIWKFEKKFLNIKNLTLYFSKSIIGRITTDENEILNKIWKELKEISLKGLWIAPKNGFGKYFIKRSFDGYFLYHSPFSFMQINEDVNKILIEEIINLIKHCGDIKILEPYAGVGNFSIPLSLNFQNITAIESSKSNYYLLLKNKENLSKGNLNTIFGNFEDVEIKSKVDLIFLDPPREGLTRKAIEKILNLSPLILIYLSCDPSTLARDLNLLSKNYSIKFIKLIDMFPQTYHIEAMAFLRVK